MGFLLSNFSPRSGLLALAYWVPIKLIGGISFIGNQYARANNPDLGEKFDKGKPKSYIFMVDCNNQYGWAMSQFLPTGGFKWIKEDDSTEEEDKSGLLAL